MFDATARPRSGVGEREEAGAVVCDLDVDAPVIGLGQQRDVVLGRQAGMAHRVRDELGGQESSDEPEILVRLELEDVLERLPGKPGRSHGRREAQCNHFSSPNFIRVTRLSRTPWLPRRNASP